MDWSLVLTALRRRRKLMAAVRSGQIIKAASIIRGMSNAIPQEAVHLALLLRKESS